jgi:endonuclease YncB( thermonuclease family)
MHVNAAVRRNRLLATLVGGVLLLGACSSAPLPHATGVGVGPTSAQLAQAEEFVDWVRDLHGAGDLLGFDSLDYTDAENGDAATSAGELASRYPRSDSPVPGLVRTAAAARADAVEAYGHRDFAGGAEAAKKTSGLLADIQAALVSEVARVEAGCGCQLSTISPRSAGVTSTSAQVIRWIDGDTVETSGGRVRLIGIDTPELDHCSMSADATRNAEAIAPEGSTVSLTRPEAYRDEDAYGRKLRYVDVQGADAQSAPIDVGFSQILSALAVARYDSRDGFPWHPREAQYRAANRTLSDDLLACLKPRSGSAYGVDEEEDEDSSDLLAVAAASLLAHMIHDADASSKAARADWARLEAQKAEAAEKAAAAKRAAEKAAAAKRAAEKSAAAKRAAEKSAAAKRAGGNRSSGSSGAGGSYPGYTGPRCYAPGGKTWKPC